MALRFKTWTQGGKSTPKESCAAPLGMMRDRFDFLRFPSKSKTPSLNSPVAQPQSPAMVLEGPRDIHCCSSSSSSSSLCEDSETEKLPSLQETNPGGESSQTSLRCPVVMPVDLDESSESENDVDDGEDSPPRSDWALPERPCPYTAAPANLPSRHRRLSMDMGAAPSVSLKRGMPRGSGRCSFDSGAVSTTHAKTPYLQPPPSRGCAANASAHTPRRSSSRRTSLDREDKEAALYYGLDKGHGGTDSKSSGPHAQRRTSSKVPSDSSSSAAHFFFQGLPRDHDAHRARFSPVELGNDLGYAVQGSPCMVVSPGFSSSFAVDSWEIGAANQLSAFGLRSHYRGSENDGEPATFRNGVLQNGNLPQGGTATFCYSGQLRKERGIQSNAPCEAEDNACSLAPQPPAGPLPVSRRMSFDLPLDVETEDYETSDMSDAAEFLATAHRLVVPVARSIRRLSLDLPVPLSV